MRRWILAWLTFVIITSCLTATYLIILHATLWANCRNSAYMAHQDRVLIVSDSKLGVEERAVLLGAATEILKDDLDKCIDMDVMLWP